MSERPILFSAAMVRAILAWNKTQTRRVVVLRGKTWAFHGPAHLDKARKDPGFGDGEYLHVPCDGTGGYGDETVQRLMCPHEVGQRLWVRETWAQHCLDSGDPPQRVVMRADGSNWWCHDPIVRGRVEDDYPTWTVDKWRPSIFMPRWASRITLEVERVRVERVQEISEMDCYAEGRSLRHAMDPVSRPGAAWFRDLWDSINAKRNDGAYAWRANPWVWAVTFRLVTTNATAPARGRRW